MKIERRTRVARIFDSEGASYAMLDCVYRFDVNDPAAVEIELSVPEEKVIWTLSRAELLRCVHEKTDTGGGDIVMMYAIDPRHGQGVLLCVHGENMHGGAEHAHLFLGRKDLFLFLVRTVAMVPEDQENYAPAVDEALRRILAGA